MLSDTPQLNLFSFFGSIFRFFFRFHGFAFAFVRFAFALVPFAFAELTADVRPPDYAVEFVRQARGSRSPVTRSPSGPRSTPARCA